MRDPVWPGRGPRLDSAPCSPEDLRLMGSPGLRDSAQAEGPSAYRLAGPRQASKAPCPGNQACHSSRIQ